MRVQKLLEEINTPMVAITITLQGNRADFGVVGNPEPQALLQALDVVRDNILAIIVRQQDRQAQAEQNAPVENYSPEQLDELKELRASIAELPAREDTGYDYDGGDFSS